MTSRANTLSPINGSHLWAQSPEAIQATAEFFADTRTLSATLGRNVDLSLRLGYDIARAVRAEARSHRILGPEESPARSYWERVERDAERAVASLLDADHNDHWWDSFEALAVSLGYVADAMLAAD